MSTPEQTQERSWERSLLSGDLSALNELGARASAAQLTAFLGPETDRAVTLAALAVGPKSADAWMLLVPLAEVANGPDWPLASTAARSALEIAASLTPATIAEHDIPDDLLADALDSWRAIAVASHRWADVRVHGLATATILASSTDPGALNESSNPERSAPSPSLLEQLAGDPDPEVRRAAFELMPVPIPDSILAVAARALAEDRDPTVALAAAQAACAGLAIRRSRGPSRDQSENPSGAVLVALGEAGLARLRGLLVADGLSPGAVLDGARCLAAAGDPESAKMLRSLQSRGPRYLRQRIRGLPRGNAAP